jgi:hypothetical protein
VRNTVRTTISIPTDLRARMDKVQENMNWSAIACSAFEIELGRIAARRQVKDIEDVVQRLRASKQESTDQSYNDGFESGQAWAKSKATALELERLTRFRDAMQELEWERCFTSESQASVPKIYEQLYYKMHPEHEGESGAAVRFWDMVVGETRADGLATEGAFVRGFSEGAIAVWKEVRHKI